MRCPHCQTENREDRVACYHCGRDLTMVRLLVTRARMHFNTAVEQAREMRYFEALGELNSALELNSRFVEAHVLKGSILARIDRVEEAREALEEALKISPQTARAHRYLLELGDVEKLTPLRRRLRLVYTGAGATVLLAAGVSIMALLHPSDSPTSTPLAGVATSEPRRTEAEALAVPELLAANGALEAAVAEVRRLGAMPLSTEGKARLAGITEALAKRSAADAATLLEALVAQTNADGAVPMVVLERFEAARARHQNLFPEHADALKQALAAHEPDARALVKQKLQAVGAEGDTNSASASLSALLPLARLVQMEEAVNARVAELAARDAERLHGEALAAAREGKTEAFEEALAAMRGLPVVPEGMLDKTTALRALLVEREQATTLASIERALADGDRVAALAMAETLEALGGAAPAALRVRLDEARRRVAIDSYYQLMEMGDRIERGEISADEASEVQRLVELARGPLPARIAAKATDNLHFFAAQAWRVLGENEKAWGEMSALRAVNPNSVYLQVE